MPDIENIILYLLLTSSLLSLTISYFLFKRRHSPGALYFSATALSVFILSVGYIIEFYSESLDTKFLGVQIQYTFGIPFTAILWFSAAINMKTFKRHPTIMEFSFLMILPVVTMLMMWTNEFHHLVYESMSLYRSDSFTLIEKKVGVWYNVNVVYSYTALILGSIILMKMIRSSQSLFRGQFIIVILIALLPWLANIIYVTGMNSYMRVDITPVAFTVSLILVEFAYRKFGLFDIVPAAHKLVIESMNSGIIVTDESDRIVEINPYLENIFSTKNIIGQNIKEILNGILHQPADDSGKIKPIEIQLGEKYFDFHRTEIKSKNSLLKGKVYTFYDITERKFAEKELRELNSSKDRLFSIIAHDLKNPFFGIIGLSNIFVTEYEDLTPDEIKTYSKEINELAGNTYRILENLLDWSRQQTGQMSFSPLRFNLKEAIDYYREIIEPQAKLKGINISANIEEDVYVFADSYMFNTVIRNLVSNALKFTYPGGKILISTKTEGNSVTVSVKDSGVGMDEKTMSKIFKIDEDIKATGTKGERGTGLGLILCKEFVEKNGGKIFIESKVGEGSIFSFTLPVMD